MDGVGLANGLAAGPLSLLTVEVEGQPVSLPDSINRTLLLVAREAIRNALAHAAPTLVSVRLEFGPGGIRLEVLDDGRGFEPAPERLAAAGRFGILGMRERMEQIGGSFEIVSRPGGGTQVGAQLPAKALALFC